MAKSCADVSCAFRVMWVTIALIVAVVITLLAVMTPGAGRPAEVTGKVTAFAMDYAPSSGVPRAVVTVELENGSTVNVLGKRGIMIGIGDEVVLLQSGGRSASDVDYRLIRLAE